MSDEKKRLIVIAGPTAIGKSSLALQLAKSFDADIFSADSRQIYKEMSIGTAKPTQKEMNDVKHHMVDIISIHDTWDVYMYEQRILKELTAFFKTKDIGILVGGTGLYINAIINGLSEFPLVDPKVLARLESEFKNEGIQFLQKKLLDTDPEYYHKVDLQNHRRLIRALSIIESSGNKFSNYLNLPPPNRPFEVFNIKLTSDRKNLYDRINKRVDLMMELGLLDEVKSLLAFEHIKALQTIGYKELFDYLNDKTSLEFAIDKIKQHSRNYAKRQTTWFNNNYTGLPFESQQFKEIYSAIKQLDNL